MSVQQSTVEYRVVEGFPAYRVGNDGSVWSRFKPGPGSRIGKTWRRLQPGGKSSGYLFVFLNPGQRCHYIHTLVLDAFVGPCPPGMECRHFPDRHPTNNSLANLRWGTRAENAADKEAHGTVPKGESHGRVKLSLAKVRRIRQQYRTGETTLKQLASENGVSESHVWRIVHYKKWRHTV